MKKEVRISISILVFIFQMTKCTFHKYGPSGSITTHDGLCILALNIINEKIFVFIWFWFAALALISIMAIAYRIVILLIPSLRVRVIMSKVHNRVNKKMVEDVLNSPKHSWIDQVSTIILTMSFSQDLNILDKLNCIH